ncbi:hypothetical protein LCGC14_1856030 [marine sediment metagenome]|uniref:Bacteriophage Mu GpT domain-containing protein n=1 Tax=marine sediment metagenome TaxID=412755 RepID=A0A0F9J864_9ZZZZ
MAQPDVSDVHVNALLSQLSIAHYNEPDAYVADKVFPIVYVQKQTDIYPKYDRGFFFADEGNAMLRAPGTKAVRAGFTIDKSNTFSCQNWAVGFAIPDELRANVDAPFDMDRDGTLLITELISIRRERAWASAFMAGSVWTGSSTGSDITVGTKWDDVTSDPIADVKAQARAVHNNVGRRPNTLLIGRIVWDRLQDHPDILDRIKGGATPGNIAIANKANVAAVLDVERILVGDSVYRSSNEGAATLTLATIMDDDALLIYLPPRPSLLAPAGGYTFVWESVVSGRSAPQFMRKYRESPEKQDVLETHTWFDHVATEPLAGAFFSDVCD